MSGVRHQAALVACPTCGVAAGQPCTQLDASSVIVHLARATAGHVAVVTSRRGK